MLKTFAIKSVAVDGKAIYITKCGSCHKSGGEAKIFAPTKYASSQWKRFFKRKKHKRRYKDISSLVSKKDINVVKEYLVQHAADSDQPEAVGLK